MKNISMRSVTVLLAALALASTAKATPLPPLYDTGQVSPSGIDSYWSYSDNNPVTNITTGQAVDVGQYAGYYTPSYSWVWTNASGTSPYPPYGPSGLSAGYPDVASFTQQFVIPVGTNLSTLLIAGNWGADNIGYIELNNTAVTIYNGGSGTLSMGPSDSQFYFDTAHPFAISGAGASTTGAPGGLFQVGTNTLTFVITNLDSVGGFDASNLLLSSVPEPSSAIMALSALGFGGACFLLRRRGAKIGS
jgi:hypothetical protein